MKNFSREKAQEAQKGKEEVDFVFLDEASEPYRVKWLGSKLWLCYWNRGSRNWVTLREAVWPQEVALWRSRALPPEQAALYEVKV